MPPHPYVTLPWNPDVIIEWLRREYGQEWIEERVKQWRKRRIGAPSKYPEDDLDVIRVAHLAVTAGVSANEAIIELIGGKVELDRRRYDRLRARCAGDHGELLPELRWLGEHIRPETTLPEGVPTAINPESLDTLIDEILKDKPCRRKPLEPKQLNLFPDWRNPPEPKQLDLFPDLPRVWGEVRRTSPTSCC